MGLRPTRERTEAARVLRRNGAYLVLVYEGETTAVGLNVDCAGSLATAKRVARRLADAVGYEGQARWTTEEDGDWELEMTEVGEEWDGQVDDD